MFVPNMYPEAVASMDSATRRSLINSGQGVKSTQLNGNNGEVTGSDDTPKNHFKKLMKHLREDAKKHHLGRELGHLTGSLVRELPGGNAAVAAANSLAADPAMRKIVQSAVDKKVNKINNKLSGSGSYTTGRGRYMTGRGMYSTEPSGVSNALVNGDSHSRVAATNGRRDENGTIVMTRSEFISPINAKGSQAYSVTTYSINPGLQGVFNWLSQIAQNYSEYQLMQLVFVYKPVVSAMSVSSVGSLGTVVMAHNPNAGEAGYSSFDQIINVNTAVEGNIAQRITCGVECDPRKSNSEDLYIRTGVVPAGQDIKTYDHGKLNIGLFGIPTDYIAGTQIGLLFAEYSVMLSKPRIWAAIGNAINTDVFCSGGGETLALPFGTVISRNQNNTLGGTMTKVTMSDYIFPDNYEGTVCVTWYFYANTAGINPLQVGDVTPSGNVVSFDAGISTGCLTTSEDYSVGTETRAVYTGYFTVTLAAKTNGNTLNFAGSSGSLDFQSTLAVRQINPLVADIGNNLVPI
jgi:hypothetical protein